MKYIKRLAMLFAFLVIVVVLAMAERAKHQCDGPAIFVYCKSEK